MGMQFVNRSAGDSLPDNHCFPNRWFRHLSSVREVHAQAAVVGRGTLLEAQDRRLRRLGA